ncbi:MAG: peptidoglycan DD-metalloendopeptidase family protein, partial [Anaerolineales bacterium]|nr:peptidoglycan DD-metalloendopeptidase family protein [Anaerolineales bacterium]
MWCTCVDWRTKRPILSRITAHLSVIALAIGALVFGSMGISVPRAVVGSSIPVGAGGPGDRNVPAALAEPALEAELPPTVTPSLDPDTISRQPLPHTIFPDRVRTDIITYVVEDGDTVFGIAAKFGLAPETIMWSNREVIKDAPWLIQPGLELFILPVDGIYHTVLAQETVASIAAEYDVDPDILYNEWNDLREGIPLREGQLLIVPNARGEEVAWTPPPAQSSPGSSGYSYGVCSGVAVTGPGANGWFTLPTGSSRVSGWYFRDPRNPTHIGLDYACRLGDPIYAADNGVVTISGWNGGYGILVEVNHGNGYITRYAHFTETAVGCGASVYQGQLLGYCGSTGYSTGPHLHF